MIANGLKFERPSNLALCSDAGQTSQARSRGRHFDVRSGADDGDSLGQEAVAMDLRRRSKNRVVEAIADEAGLAIGQESDQARFCSCDEATTNCARWSAGT